MDRVGAAALASSLNALVYDSASKRHVDRELTRCMMTSRRVFEETARPQPPLLSRTPLPLQNHAANFIA
eukprot:2036154-Pyramimonas_sp.AAC.1